MAHSNPQPIGGAGVSVKSVPKAIIVRHQDFPAQLLPVRQVRIVLLVAMSRIHSLVLQVSTVPWVVTYRNRVPLDCTQTQVDSIIVLPALKVSIAFL